MAGSESEVMKIPLEHGAKRDLTGGESEVVKILLNHGAKLHDVTGSES